MFAGVVLSATAIADAQVTIYVDPNAPGPNNGESWCGAFTDFQTALQVAQDNLDLVTEIRVSAGTYTPAGPGGMRTTSFILPTRDVAMLGGFAGCASDDPDERNLSAYPTILSGDLNGDDFTGGDISENSYHVVFAGDTASTVLLDGFIIEGGHANSPNNPGARGAGIFVFFSPAYLTIRNCIIRRNTAEKGGGMYNFNMHGKLVNCLFTGNSAIRIDGGAMFNVESDLELINCTFSGNTATRNAGGIYLASPDTPVLTNCIFWGNSDSRGMDQGSQINLAGKPVVANYNCIQGWTGLHPGVGNIGNDPLFLDADGADNVAGTGDDDLRVQLGSQSIGAGDPTFGPAPSETDLEGEPRLQGCRVDMGAYEAWMEQIPGDFDGDGLVNLADLAGFQLCMGSQIAKPDWLDTCLCLFDADENDEIDLDDFAAFQAILTGTSP